MKRLICCLIATLVPVAAGAQGLLLNEGESSYSVSGGRYHTRDFDGWSAELAYSHHGIIDFWQAYPRYIDQAQPSLYVRGSALAVHESIKGNYQLTKSKNILPWLTTGCYGEFASEKIEPMIYEALLNGSAGITYYAFQYFDTPLDFYYHAKALATIARYEAFIVKALPYTVDSGHGALTASALMDSAKRRVMILLGNYGSARDITTTITLPFESTASVRDLLQGRELNTNNNQVGVTIKGGGFVLLWADTGRP